MKNFTTQLIAFLAANRDNIARVDLFDIALTNGTTLHTTSWGSNVVLSGTTYNATKYGVWKRGTVTTTATYDATPESMPLTVVCDLTHTFPGTSMPIIQSIANSVFDKATVTAKTAYMPKDFNAIGSAAPAIDPNMVTTKFLGDVGGSDDETPITSTTAVLSVVGWTYRLQDPWPIKVVQSGCSNCLFDKNCQVLPASFVVTNTVASGSNPFTLNLGTTLAQAAPYYDKGFIQFTSGQNSGIQKSIATQNSTTQIALAEQFPFPILPGDAMNMYPGCDGLLGTCTTKFSNAQHFQGAPFTPDAVRAVTQS